MKIVSFLRNIILAFAIGYFLFGFAVDNVALNSAPTPWVIITLLLFSSSYCIQALLKLSEADEHTSLTSEELRRLRPIIRTKKARLVTILCYHILSATSVAIGFFIVPTNSDGFPFVFKVTGALVMSSLYSFFFIKSMMDEVQSFKSKLIHRDEEKKRRKKLLDALSKSPNDRA